MWIKTNHSSRLSSRTSTMCKKRILMRKQNRCQKENSDAQLLGIMALCEHTPIRATSCRWTVAENGTPLQALLSLQLFKLQRYLKFCGPQVAHFEKVSSFNLPRPCPKADLLRFPRRKRSIETAENQWLDGCATTISTKT